MWSDLEKIAYKNCLWVYEALKEDQFPSKCVERKVIGGSSERGQECLVLQFFLNCNFLIWGTTRSSLDQNSLDLIISMELWFI